MTHGHPAARPHHVPAHPYFKRGKRHHPAPPGSNPSPPPPVPPSHPSAWTIPNLCKAYHWPTGLPGGGIIGILEMGGGWNPADVDRAFQAMGQPSPTIVDVSVDGRTNNAPGSDADGEVALDIQAAGCAYFMACGKPATIRMYWGSDMAACVARAATDGCAVFSISWGSSESNWAVGTGQGSLAAMDAAAALAVAKGTVILAASGDNDADDGGGAACVDGPASCPHVIACGGTSLPVGGSGGGGEKVWNDTPGNPGGEGTGGGYSSVFAFPTWQVGAPPPPARLGRMVPDIAANADPATGLEIMLDGQVEVFGGTSFVAPFYAGLLAAISPTGLGLIAPLLWQHSEIFNDITQGENGVYNATTGPDPCTGLGSPIGTAIAALFTSSATVPTT